MNDGMAAVLAGLPRRLGAAAGRLWRDSSRTTDEVTETLRVSYKVLRQVCGDPAALTVAGELLSGPVAEEIGRAHDEIDAVYPAATESWQGSGAESFRRYLPRLSDSLRSVADSASHTGAAVTLFRDGVEDVYTTIVERTDLTGAEVAAVQAATRQSPHEAIGPVIDIIGEYSTYVEELATTMLELTSDSHAAGRRLAQAAGMPAGLNAAADGPRLPRLDIQPGELRPTHPRIWLDTAAMARLTASLSDNGTHFDAAARSSRQAAEQLTPDALGLAGAHFHGDVHTILERDREVYATVNGHLDGLALELRRATAGFAAIDDAAAAELRRGLDETP